MSLLPGQAWRCRNPSIDSISSVLQESDISIRILSEIKIRTDEDSSERSFLAASCSDGSLTKTISCSDSDAGSSFASLRIQYPIVDNNSAERALKNFAVGRRNWLFAKSVRGAGASALVYSITETALLNHLKPYAYLTYILDELRKMGAFPKEKELKKLLPWSEDLPEYCRTKLKK